MPDRIRPGVRVLFVGINPGIRSAKVGHHFAGYSNRFWKLLYESGLVPEPLIYEEDGRLPEWRYGMTNLIRRPSAGIDSLRREEYAAGRRRLLAKIRKFRPEVVALVGVTIYRRLFPPGRNRGIGGGGGREASASRRAWLGLQPETVHGARIFVLPNPSGRNAHFPYARMLGAFRSLKRYLERR